MKIAKLLLLSVAVLLFSCDEDDPMPTSKGMVGTWAVTAVDYKGSTTTTAQGVNLKADFTGTGKDMNMIATFNETPNTFTTEGSYTIVLKTTMMGQTETEEMPFEGVFSNGTWTLSSNTLTITTPDGEEKATVIEQTPTTLKFKAVIAETETDMGFTVKTNVEAVYSFQKR